MMKDHSFRRRMRNFRDRRSSWVADCALVAALSLIVISCAGNPSSESDRNHEPGLTVGLLSAPASLQPAKAVGYGATFIFSLTNEPLLSLAKDGSVGAGLASSFRYVGTDNRVLELRIRPDVRFSDDEPLSAMAVKRYIEYFAKTPGPNNSKIAVESVDLIDAMTIQIRSVTPNPLMPFYLAAASKRWGSVASPVALQDPSKLESTSAGAGQYAIEPSQTIAGDHYTFLPNPFYYDKSKIRFEKIIVKIVANASSMLQAIQAGQLDAAQGDVSTADAATRSGLSVQSALNANNGMVFLDLAGAISKPLADPRVRQALNYAVDRTGIEKSISGQYGHPVSQWTTVDGQDKTYLDYYAYDPAKAKGLLVQAGYPNGFAFSAECLSVLAPYVSNMCASLAEGFRKIGVSLDLVSPSTPAELSQKLSSNTLPAFIGFSPVFHTWEVYTSFLKPGGEYNQHNFADPEITQEAASAALSDNQHGAVFWQNVMRRTVTQAYFVPLFASDALWYFPKRISGVSLSGPYDWDRAIAMDWFEK